MSMTTTKTTATAFGQMTGGRRIRLLLLQRWRWSYDPVTAHPVDHRSRRRGRMVTVLLGGGERRLGTTRRTTVQGLVDKQVALSAVHLEKCDKISKVTIRIPRMELIPTAFK